MATPTRRPNKRQRSPDRPSQSPTQAPAAGLSLTRRASESSLPPSSPLGFSDTDSIDDRDAIPNLNDDDDDGEDLFAEDMLEEDYADNEGVDRYSDTGLDDEGDFEALTAAQRRAAERNMDRRDTRRGSRASRRGRAFDFLGDEEDDDGELDEDLGVARMRRRTRRQYDERRELDDMEGVEDDMPLEQVADVKAQTISEWLAVDRVRRSATRHLRTFLTTYVDDVGNSVYGSRIKDLGETNSESLEISFLHLTEAVSVFAYFLLSAPAAMLSILDEVAMNVVLHYYPAYDKIHPEIHVRICDIPKDNSLRDLRRSDLNCLVRVGGVVTRRTGVFPQLKSVKFNCVKCGGVLGPFAQDGTNEIKIGFCPNCESKGPFPINTELTVYQNYQKITLQESPGSVPAGRLPRHREVILRWDLIDNVKPGEEVEVTGIYRNNFDASLNARNGFPVFSTIIEANHINKKEDAFAAFRLTEQDREEMRELAKDDRVRKRIIKSIAPSIYGHEDIKTAIALSLFGGVAKNIDHKHHIRGDINVLLLGDPGTAKSQFLKYVEKTAHRSVYATGQGASAVGLTASVRKDPMTKEWTLEGGALVLADKGTCIIDEFDKMNDSDRTSIHEAMEQQSISISKAGIVTSLQARCAVVAAANPIRGRYNPTIPFAQNVELTEPILSRFDVLCVVKDLVDPVMDELLARFVVGSHSRSHPRFDRETDEIQVATALDEDIIPQDILRKYIIYARENVRPQLYAIDNEKMQKLYADLRRESLATGSFPITVRHLESMIRMSEASAKMALREYVRGDDIDLAIEVAVNSFVNAQKMSVKKTLQRGFRKYLTHAKDHEELLGYLLGQLVKGKARQYQLTRYEQPELVTIKVSELEDQAKEHDIYDVRPFLRSRLFTTNGYTLVEGDVIEKRFRRQDD
jgi:DNA replication licensing factor MCM2